MKLYALSNSLFIALLLIFSSTLSIKITNKLKAKDDNLLRIVGTVSNSDDTPIKKSDIEKTNTKVTFFNIDLKTFYKATFPQDGYYQVTVPPGRYERYVESDQYFESYERTLIDKLNTKDFDYYKLYLAPNGKRIVPTIQTVNIRGYISDSTTGKPLAEDVLSQNNVSVVFRNRDTNETTKATILPGSLYSADLISGNYTRIASMDHFSDAETKVKVRVSSTEKDKNNRILMSREVKGFRIVLTWEAVPTDLDTHLIVPSGAEVNYNNKAVGDSSLDVDATEGYGPETLSIPNVDQGTYMHYVQNFSKDGSLVNCNARVVVYSGNKQVLDITAPTTGDTESYYWHTFNYDGSTGKITVVNKILDSAPAPVASV